jgi:hypothetical protein
MLTIALGVYVVMLAAVVSVFCAASKDQPSRPALADDPSLPAEETPHPDADNSTHDQSRLDENELHSAPPAPEQVGVAELTPMRHNSPGWLRRRKIGMTQAKLRRHLFNHLLQHR